MQTIEQQSLIPEERILTPLVEVLKEVTPKPISESPPKETARALTKSLDELFPEQQYDERNVQKAKEILGPLADQFTTDELKDVVSEVQYLVASWLDDFERDIFGGLTLKEVLHEKGNL